MIRPRRSPILGADGPVGAQMAAATLVLIHGLLDDRHMWAHQRRHLAACAPLATPDILTEDTLDRAAERVLAASDGPLAVAGFSMGGYVVFELLRRAPQRLARIALISTQARADTPEKSAERQRAIASAEAGGYEDVVDAALPEVVHPDRVADRTLMAELRTMALRVGPEAYVRQQKIIAHRPDSRPDLAAIACPALVICGRQDRLTPPALSEEMAAAIPGARLTLLDECGHYAPMERPFATTALLQQWLRHP